jgi:hypothetical protein
MLPVSIIEEMAFPPPPPTPITFIFAILALSGFTSAMLLYVSPHCILSRSKKQANNVQGRRFYPRAADL